MQSLSKHWVTASNDFRRRYERKDYSADIVFAHHKQIFQGSLKNISIGGAFILSSQVNHMYEGELVSLSIPYTDGFKHVKRKGRVLWKNDIGFAIGFV